jgi:glycosyltransferase involved in cell wall biosynthesis
VSNNVDFIIDSARYFQERSDRYIFKIAGKGSEQERILSRISEEGIRNIEWLGYKDKFAVRDILNDSDANLITFSHQSILQTNSPNKFFDGIAAGKLSIINIPGWISEMCLENHCGIFVSVPELFFDQIEAFRNDPELLKQYQQNARKLAETKFNKERLSLEIVQILEKQVK